MSAQIPKDKLRIRISSHAGEVKAYQADLTDFLISIDANQDFKIISYNLRAILRAKVNLEDSIIAISELEQRRSSEQSFGYVNRSLFAYAVMLYGACFLKGGAMKTVPLEKIAVGVEELQIHKDIMNYRHKLIGHLDENHQVRTDTLGWEIAVENDGLVPKGPSLSGVKTLLVFGDENGEWIHHMQEVIRLIDAEAADLISKVNSALHKFRVTD